jgi:hypothetical protein
MNKNLINWDSLRGAASSALDRVKTVSGQETDPDLMLYQQLKPGDFPKLIDKYGQDNVMQYIKTMEAKLASRGASNG